MVCCKFRLKNEHYQWIRYFGFCTKVCTTIYRIVMRILGPIFFFSANFLILSVAGILMYYFIPQFCEENSFLYVLNMLIGFYLIVNIEFNFFACCFTPPGSPSYCPDPGRVLGEKVSIVDGRKIYQFSYQLQIAPFVTYKYCHTCKSIKPPRAHHCK